jgi:hypothetical protein
MVVTDTTQGLWYKVFGLHTASLIAAWMWDNISPGSIFYFGSYLSFFRAGTLGPLIIPGNQKSLPVWFHRLSPGQCRYLLVYSRNRAF